jgi:hypothetical protein
MTLPAQELIRRVLPHVVPQGFHKVRDSGLWSPLHRPLLHPRQLWLARPAPDPPPASPGPASQPTDAGWPPLRAGQTCPHGGQGLLVLIRLLPRPPRGPPCATEPPCGRPMPASSAPQLPGTAASYHPGALRPQTTAGSPRPPRPAASRSHPPSASSPLCPPPWIPGTPSTIPRRGFPSGAGCLKIPDGLEPRFRATPLLCRLRATKTFIR